MSEQNFFVHESAIVDAGAEVGTGTRIWHFSHVSSGTRIGSGCVFGQNVFVAPGVQIGDRVKIQNNVSVYAGVTLEDEVFCGPSMVFTNVVNPRAGIEKKDEFRETVVRRGATLGANCTVVCGVELGAYCLIGAGAVVTGDVAPHALMTGVAAKQVGWVSRHGERLDLPVGGAGEATCPATSEAYELVDGVLHVKAN